MIGEHDERTIRCRRLGHAVTFRYCRTQEGESVCPLILDCWWESFDVRGFLQAHLPPEQMEGIERPEPRPKVVSLLEMIKRARRRAQDGQDA
ncbi:MAG: hypothetical protein AMK73_02865 [Planctomycetes bacterium SM23_32]|nr:MAG: hypothetical protein AMK73_02865 [Planctomycetes bacterium SM23_32]